MAKFVSNSISLGKSSFADFASKVINAQNQKLASANSTVKTASTNVKEAELSEGQKKLPQALQDAIKAKGEGKKDKSEDKEDKKENKSEDKKEDKKEDKVEDKKEKECTASTGSNEKGAPSSGQLDVEPLHQTGESTGEKKDKKNDNPNPAKDEKKETKKEDKEAVSSTGFIRISKLNSENKSMLKKYYDTIYPAGYADALIADY
jgi:hypothetical protein